MHIKTLALIALAGLSSAETLRFTRISPPSLGLARRSLDDGYTPEETECGAGDTCSEACGAGFEQCGTADGVSSCFNPGEGEVCCDAGVGASCQKGFFCTLDTAETTVCCADGMSLDECAALNDAEGGLTSGAPSSDAPSPTAKSTPAESTAEPTTSAPATTFTSAPASTGFASNGTTAAPTGTGTGAVPSSTLPVEEGPDSGAAGLVPAAALLAGAVALVL